MIHETAFISPNAIIGDNVEIGAFCIIHPGVHIGDNTKIGNYCEIGLATPLAKTNTLEIGKSSCIRSHSVLYIGSIIGDKFNTGHYVTVRENSVIGSNCQIGSRGDIQGDCSIGDYTKMHADVHVGKLSKIGQFVWMFPGVLLTNDPTPPSEELKGITIEDYVVVASKAVLMPGITLGKDSVIAVGSIVKDSVKPGMLASGHPAKQICKSSILRHHNNPAIKAYPWRYRFHRGYTDEQIKEWENE
ncbi:acyltransferase [Photorhabdus heterorhabditis]|uniref:Acetyltransferase n=1 Tax=Photorhabdus heterorhabditis TaxID=880156 RepID=A0A5B0X602_9GAMM|nr:acyltransferase [Photorhabdus heterorhabditis]KAA1194780.1 N-acetyltransferase [Photorhabdus heterorhabditis]KOY60618.1 acetyltransferase [Photorhabdus heterorhabditis]